VEIFRLFGTVLLQDQAAQAGLDSLDRKARKVDGAFAGMLKSAAAWGAGLLSLYAIAAFTKRVFTATEALDGMSARLGLSIGRLQELKFAAEQSDVSFESLGAAIAAMTRLLMGAEMGGDVQAQAFDRLGVSIYETGGQLRGTDEIFEQALANLADMGNETERNGLAMKIFGRGASELIPLLNRGSEGIAELSARARELGLVTGDEGVQAMDRLGHSVATLGGVIQSKVAGAITTALPTLQKAVDWVTVNLPKISNAFEVVGTTVVAILSVKVAGAVAGFLANTSEALVQLGAKVALFVAGLGPVGWAIIAFTAAAAGLVLLLRKAPQSFAPVADAARSTGEEFEIAAKSARNLADGIEDAQSASEAYWASRELQSGRPDAPSVIDPTGGGPPEDAAAKWLKYWEGLQKGFAGMGATLMVLDAQWGLLQARMSGGEGSFEYEAAAASHLKAETAELDRQIVELTATYKSLVAMKGEDAEETQTVLLLLLQTETAAANLAAGIRLTSDEIHRMAADAASALAPLSDLFDRVMLIAGEQGLDVAQWASMEGDLMRGGALDLSKEQKAALWAEFQATYNLMNPTDAAAMFERMYGFKPPVGHQGGQFVVPGGGEGLALLQSGEFVLPEAKAGQVGATNHFAPGSIVIHISGSPNATLSDRDIERAVTRAIVLARLNN
jgi:hypothetical protein